MFFGLGRLPACIEHTCNNPEVEASAALELASLAVGEAATTTAPATSPTAEMRALVAPAPAACTRSSAPTSPEALRGGDLMMDMLTDTEGDADSIAEPRSHRVAIQVDDDIGQTPQDIGRPPPHCPTSACGSNNPEPEPARHI